MLNVYEDHSGKQAGSHSFVAIGAAAVEMSHGE